MPYYLFTGRYSTDAIKAMVAKPQDREAAARKLIEGIGGKLHHLFFAFGDEDVYALIEAPDDRAMAAGAMVVGASGSMSGGKTIKLMTAQEAMEAMKAAGKAASGYTPATG